MKVSSLLILPLLLLVSCKKADSSKTITVGFSQIGAESDWRKASMLSIKEEAKCGIELKFSDAQQKQENQLKAIRAFIAQGVDAIASHQSSPRVGTMSSRKQGRRTSLSSSSTAGLMRLPRTASMPASAPIARKKAGRPGVGL